MSHPERDGWFRAKCDEIARQRGVLISVEDGVAYLDSADTSRVALCRPDQSRMFWHGVWLALKFGTE